MVTIGNDWDDLLRDEWDKPYYQKLREFLREEYSSGTVYPPADDIFNALRLTPYSEVKAVILGQDPYHEPGQAQGLAFSVPYDVPQPPSHVNIVGIHAGAKRDLILNAQGADRRHLIIQAPHPSPLSAYRGFFGGRYFSRCNYFLEDNGIEPVDWSL